MSNTDYCSEMTLSPPTSVDNIADPCNVDNDESYSKDASFAHLDVPTNDLNREWIPDQHNAFYTFPAATMEDDAGFALMSHLLSTASSMTDAIGAPTGLHQHNLWCSAPTAISSLPPSLLSITPTSAAPVSVAHQQNDSNTNEEAFLPYRVPFIAPEDIPRQQQQQQEHALHQRGQPSPPATVIATISSPIIPTTTHVPLIMNDGEMQGGKKIAIKTETSSCHEVTGLSKGGTTEKTAKKKREYKRKTQTQQLKQVAAAKSNDMDKEERRQKRLLRNRLAAKECREKKRQHLEALEKRVVQLEEENERLRESIDRLNENSHFARINPMNPTAT